MDTIKLKEDIRKVAITIKTENQKRVKVIARNNAEGISGSAMILKACWLNEINFDFTAKTHFDNKTIDEIQKEDHEMIILIGLGENYVKEISEKLTSLEDQGQKAKKIIMVTHEKIKSQNHDGLSDNPYVQVINPHFYESDTAVKKLIRYNALSYLIAKEMDGRVKDNSELALIGEKLSELNELQKEILSDCEQSDIIRLEKNLKNKKLMLDACCKLSKGSLAVAVCLNDKSMQEKAVQCHADYHEELNKSIDWFYENRNNKNIIESENYTIINAKDKILGTIVGKVTSSISNHIGEKEEKYVMGMARLMDNKTKVSLRLSRMNESKEVDLKAVMKEIMSKVEVGKYGGSKESAGAIIPQDKEENIIEIAKNVLEKRNLEEGVM